MGIVINLRGTAGAGKTAFVRRILADYGWDSGVRFEPVSREGRLDPLAYLLPHPCGGRPIAVLGHYRRRSGGCDTITLADGGLDLVFRMAARYACTGYDVLLEGRALSFERERSATLAGCHPLHLLCLDTSPEECLDNLRRRMRIGGERLSGLRGRILAERTRLLETCHSLRSVAAVEHVGFGDGVAHARRLLGLPVEDDGPDAPVSAPAVAMPSPPCPAPPGAAPRAPAGAWNRASAAASSSRS